jgi:hypothetical protein
LTGTAETPSWGPGTDPVAAAIVVKSRPGTGADTDNTGTAPDAAKTPEVLSGIKGKLAAIKVKRDKVKVKASDASAKAGAAYTKTASTREKINKVKVFVDPRNGQKWSFAWAVVASWVIGPQTMIAAYERLSGDPDPSGWGLMYGPGRWMRDTIKFAWEGGHMPALWMGALLGFIPMLIMSVPGKVLNTRQMAWIVGGGLAVYFTGSAEDYHLWPPIQAWQLYVATLAAVAYYCGFIAFKRKQKANAAIEDARVNGVSEEGIRSMGSGGGPVQMLLMLPAASIFSVVLYAPGAAF